MASVTDFQTRFPEFSAVAADRIQMFLNDTALNMKGPEKWMGFYHVAQMYYTAHLLISAMYTADGETSPLGPISQQEVDDVLLKSAVSSAGPAESELLSTSYGKRYYEYRRKCLPLIIGV